MIRFFIHHCVCFSKLALIDSIGQYEFYSELDGYLNTGLWPSAAFMNDDTPFSFYFDLKSSIECDYRIFT